jgi:hypothetical protein
MIVTRYTLFLEIELTHVLIYGAMEVYGGMEIRLHAFLTLVLSRGLMLLPQFLFRSDSTNYMLSYWFCMFLTVCLHNPAILTFLTPYISFFITPFLFTSRECCLCDRVRSIVHRPGNGDD